MKHISTAMSATWALNNCDATQTAWNASKSIVAMYFEAASTKRHEWLISFCHNCLFISPVENISDPG